jgi:hypothetical protein
MRTIDICIIGERGSPERGGGQSTIRAPGDSLTQARRALITNVAFADFSEIPGTARGTRCPAALAPLRNTAFAWNPREYAAIPTFSTTCPEPLCISESPPRFYYNFNVQWSGRTGFAHRTGVLARIHTAHRPNRLFSRGRLQPVHELSSPRLRECWHTLL